MKTRALVEAIFSAPTAPFREHQVLSKIRRVLSDHEIPYFDDDVGNIVAGVKEEVDLQTGRGYVGLMAHTDPPGFHLKKRIKKNLYSGFWFGDGPFKTMKGAKVRIHYARSHG